MAQNALKLVVAFLILSIVLPYAALTLRLASYILTDPDKHYIFSENIDPDASMFDTLTQSRDNLYDIVIEYSNVLAVPVDIFNYGIKALMHKVDSFNVWSEAIFQTLVEFITAEGKSISDLYD